jgi:hypothetical protein
MANLQVRLPAGVIGGGLTAIDTATELMAYYLCRLKNLHAMKPDTLMVSNHSWRYDKKKQLSLMNFWRGKAIPPNASCRSRGRLPLFNR